jgi:CTD kinase subunit gamma
LIYTIHEYLLSLKFIFRRTQLSIQRVGAYALKYFSRFGDDLWECIVDECRQVRSCKTINNPKGVNETNSIPDQGTLNMRINILYLLDTLCESSLMQQPSQSSSSSSTAGTSSQTQPADQGISSYVQYVARDLDKIVDLVVPNTRDGLINLLSTRQVEPLCRA